MHAVCARRHRFAPVVIDEKLRAAAAAGGDATLNFPFQSVAMQGFAAQLNRVRPRLDHTFHPLGGGDDGVKFQRGFQGGKTHDVAP